MKSEHEYFNDLTQIRSMMERSTKFLSLAGWSGIVAGVIGLLASILVIWQTSALGSGLLVRADFSRPDDVAIMIIALTALVLSVAMVALFSGRKARSQNQPVWNAAARRLIFSMAVPLAVGGVLSILLGVFGIAGLIPAATLLFYGVAMFVAGNFTFSEMRYMGIIEMILGLWAVCQPQYSLVIWGIGFGALHIVYGIYLHLRYEK